MKINSILLSGDYHIYGPFGSFITKHPQHKVICDNLIKTINNSQLSVFNLEDPITNSPKGIRKHGPHGVGPEESLIPIKKAGFQLATFATNHTYDMGDQGIQDTLDACAKYGIDVVGAGLTKEAAREPYYKKIGDQTICILNFSRIEYNAVSDEHGGANPLDVIENTRDIIEAKKNAHLVFVVVHEGVDVFHLPYPRLVQQMRFYADMGADAIIMHHSRIISGYEVYKNVPIFYGLGNLLHLTKNTDEHTGLVIRFFIEKGKPLRFEILPVQFDKKAMFVKLCEGRQKQEVMDKVDKLSSTIQNEELLKEKWQEHVLNKKALYLSIMAGYPRIIYRVAKKFKALSFYEWLLATFCTKNHLARWNVIKCQAHIEAINQIYDDELTQ